MNANIRHPLSACATLAALVAFCAPVSRAASATDAEEYGLDRIELLQPPRPHTWLQVSSDSDFHYTSNELLLPDTGLFPALEDQVFAETLGLGITPPLPVERLTGELYFRQQFVRYLDRSEYNFNDQTVGIRMNRSWQNGFLTYGGVSADQFIRCNDNTEFFKSVDVQAGVWREVSVCACLSVDGGYQFDWRPTSPASYTRIDNTCFFGASVRLADGLTARLLYRGSLRSYTRDDHHDFNQLATAQVKYELNPYVALTLYASYGRNDSNRSFDDYNVFDVGSGLRLSASF